MARWKVEMTTESRIQLQADFKIGKITAEDNQVIKLWIAEVESEGIEYAQANKDWRDHTLDGEWKGHRSISFSYSGRVIYRVEAGKVIVRVVRVTAAHDYKK